MPKKITIPRREFFNEQTCEFVYTDEQTLTLEHSLVSISKWESKWKKSYITEGPATLEEELDYIRCMTITQNVNEKTYYNLTQENLEEIKAYIEDPMTATTFREEKQAFKKEKITSEIIYHWMITYDIPFECQKWHLNRLLTLIRVRAIQNAPSKKMSMEERKALNEMRRKSRGTRG